MLDPDYMSIRPDLQLAGLLTFRDLGIKRRPFRTPLAALETEAGLLAAHAAVTFGRVDRHVAGVTLLVAKLVGARLENQEIIVAGQALDAAGAGNTHLVLGLGVVGFEVGKRERPVEQRGTLDLAVIGKSLEFMLLESQRCACPVRGCAANRLDDPGRQVRKVLRDTPATAGRAVVQPGELGKTVPFVIDEVAVFDARSRFQNDDVDAFCASSLPSVPPPAPEPMMTTTLSSSRSYFAAMVSSQRR